MAYHMPLDILWQGFILLRQLLRLILAEDRRTTLCFKSGKRSWKGMTGQMIKENLQNVEAHIQEACRKTFKGFISPNL